MIAERLLNLRRTILRPQPTLNLVEWADNYRCLSPESSSKAGKWKTSQVEVARGVMLAYSDPDVKKITVMSCTQLLKTEFINNIVGYHIHLDPAPIIVMQPNEKLGETWSKDRLETMLRDSPELKAKTRGTVKHKLFDGGQLSIIGSNAPGDLSMRPVKIVLCDEVDKYPLNVAGEGDPIALIAERQAVFWDRKIVQVCSPTIEETSRINQEYLASDQRKYKAVCGYCKTAQTLEWKSVKWDEGKPGTAKYFCVKCEKGWSEKDRRKAIDAGYWEATADFNGHAGFQVSKLYSIWETIPEIANKYVEAQNNNEKLKVFINTQLAEVWKTRLDTADWRKLYDRRENYKSGTVPFGGLILTASADVQHDRLEIEIVAWGRGLSCWIVDYIVMMGKVDSVAVKNKIKKLLDREFIGDSGFAFKIKMLAIDSGYNSSAVYDLVRSDQSRMMAIKGIAGASKPIISAPNFLDVSTRNHKVKSGVALWGVGVYSAKDEIFSRLTLEYELDEGTGEVTYPEGYYYFNDQPVEYFKMLCSEVLVAEKDRHGYAQYTWKKTRKRNEALDCRVYNRACASRLGLEKYTEKHWLRLEKYSGNYDKTNR